MMEIAFPLWQQNNMVEWKHLMAQVSDGGSGAGVEVKDLRYLLSSQ